MSLFIFTKNILNNKKIIVYNKGNMHRDFTYIDDIVDVVYRLTISKKSKEILTYLILEEVDQFN